MKCLEMLRDRDILSVRHECREALPADDVVIEYENRLLCYQAKHSDNEHGLLAFDDLTRDHPLGLHVKRLKEAWQRMNKGALPVEIIIHTNRAADASLAKVLTGNCFDDAFITNQTQKTIRKKLYTKGEFKDDHEFRSFANALRFELRQPSQSALRNYVKEQLLGQVFGITAQPVLDRATDIARAWWLESTTRPIRRSDVEQALRIDSTSMPQVFEVDYNHYVDREAFTDEIETKLNSINRGYISLVGPPGCGKSSYLSDLARRYSRRVSFRVVQYYCFTRAEDPLAAKRLYASEFLKSVIDQLQRQFAKELPYERRFDYTRDHLITMLSQLSKQLKSTGTRLLIIVDGLDAVQRDKDGFAETLDQVLPSLLPEEVVCILGTQGLQYLPALIQNECSGDRLIRLPMFSEGESIQYLRNYESLRNRLNVYQFGQVHRRSEGLPLYLRYLASKLGESSEPATNTEIESIPILGGDIEKYYAVLWAEVTTDSDVLHLLGIISVITFDISPADLYDAISVDAFKGKGLTKRIQNVLTVTKAGIRIYHNSFRQYILNQIDEVEEDQLETEVLEFLKTRKGSSPWYGHIARFTLVTGEYDYLKTLATQEFVDRAIQDGRPFNEILSTLTGAVRACVASSDPVSLARIAQLYSNTVQRLQYNLDKHLLFRYWMTRSEVSKALSLVTSDGRLNDFSIETARLLLDLADGDSFETGKQLAREFLESFKEEVSSSNVRTLSLILATYASNPARWIAGVLLDYGQVREGHDEETIGESLLPRLFDTLYKYKTFNVLRPIKRVLLESSRQPFWRDQLYYNIAVCETRYHPERAESHVRVAEARVHNEGIRTKLAGLAARQRFDANLVAKLLGSTKTVPSVDNNSLSYFTGRRSLEHFRDYASALAATNRVDEIQALTQYFEQSATWMSEYYKANLQLEGALCSEGLGTEVINATLFGIFDRLTNRKTPRSERFYEVFDVIRRDLPEFLRRAIEGLIQHGADPERIVTACSNFGSSDLISRHFGIGLVVASYENEISAARTLSRHPTTLRQLKPYLQQLHDKIRQQTLETQTRSEHCLRIAALAAYCQFGDTAADWFEEALAASKGYGHRKDITISILTDVMGVANQIDSAGAARRIADIADLNQWLPHITDGKETHWFEISLFEAAQKLGDTIALSLLPTYREVIGYWKFSECLQRYLTSFNGENIGLAYILSELVDECKDHLRHPWNGKARARIALVEKAAAHSDTTLSVITDHLSTFLTTVVPPAERRVLIEEYNEVARKYGLTTIDQYWFEDSSSTTSQARPTSAINSASFQIDGNKLSHTELIKLMKSSTSEFCRIADQVKNSEQRFLLSGETEAIGVHFLQETTNKAELETIADALLQVSHHDAKVHIAIAEGWGRLGEHSLGLKHRRLAFESLHAWGLWDKNLGYIAELFDEDGEAAMSVVMETIQTYVLQYNTGFGAPLLLAKAIKLSKRADDKDIITIYNDYRNLTQEQFADLPQRKSSPYEWLRSETIDTQDFDKIALALLNRDWIDPEYHRRINLVHLIGQIALVQDELIPQLVIPCLKDSNETRRTLAALVIDFIACSNPVLLNAYLADLVDALIVPNANVSESLLHALDKVKENSALPAGLNAAIESAERANAISSSVILLNGAAPSETFRHKLKRLLWFSESAESCATLMGYDLNELYWRIEQEALNQHYDYEEAEEYDEDLARAHVHPQGAHYSLVPFESYSLRVFANALLKVVEAILRSGEVDEDTIYAVRRRLRSYDPCFPWRQIKALPQEYRIACIANSSGKSAQIMSPEDWFGFKDLLSIGDHDKSVSRITIYEHYRLIQGPYVETSWSMSRLISNSLANKIRGGNTIAEIHEYVLQLAPESEYYTMSIEEAQDFIERSRVMASPRLSEQFPLIVLHMGDWWIGHPYEIAGLAGVHVKMHGLIWNSHDSLDMQRDGVPVVDFNVWQDGIAADTYEYRGLSAGTRLRVAKDLLDDILKETGKTLLTVNHYTRRISEDTLYGREPQFKPAEKTVFRLYG